MRGRNRAKGPNPLTRAFESNGPDVKIRGTAQHIADKYAQLARDAQASGDPVSAENYLQHAEHYYRMIAAAQEQFRQQYGGGPRGFDEDGDETEEEGTTGFGAPGADRSNGPAEDFGEGAGFPAQGFDPRADRPIQPRFDRNDSRQNRPQRFERDRFDMRGGPERNERFGGDRFERPPQDRQNGERYERSNGERYDRQDRRDRFPRDAREPRPDREGRPEREFRHEREPRHDRPARAEDRFGAGPEDEREPSAAALPAFLTTPVRPVVAVDEGAPEAAVPRASDEGEAEFNAGPGIRPRRRRVRKAEAPDETASGGLPEGPESAPE